MKPIKITSFEQIDALHAKGMNICKGCKYEHAASCTPERFAVCTEQANRHTHTQQPETATETPQISTEAAETVECTTESETAQDAAYMQPHNIKYFAGRFGNWQNFNKCYEDATKAVCAELDGYHIDRRKGGSYRRRKMDALQKQLKTLNAEWIQLSIVLAEYWGVSSRPPKTASQSPEIPPKVNHTTPMTERDHGANKQPNSAYLTPTT